MEHCRALTGGFIFNIVTAVRDKKLCCFLGSIAALGAYCYQLYVSVLSPRTGE